MILFLWLGLLIIGSYTLAAALCLSLMLTPLMRSAVFGELAKPRQLTELEANGSETITLSPDDWWEV